MLEESKVDLCYLWVDKSYNGFLQDIDINISVKFYIKYDLQERLLMIEEKTNYIKEFWKDEKYSVIGVVGKNGAGKTTILNSIQELYPAMVSSERNNIVVIYANGKLQVSYKEGMINQIKFNEEKPRYVERKVFEGEEIFSGTKQNVEREELYFSNSKITIIKRPYTEEKDDKNYRSAVIPLLEKLSFIKYSPTVEYNYSSILSEDKMGTSRYDGYDVKVDISSDWLIRKDYSEFDDMINAYRFSKRRRTGLYMDSRTEITGNLQMDRYKLNETCRQLTFLCNAYDFFRDNPLNFKEIKYCLLKVERFDFFLEREKELEAKLDNKEKRGKVLLDFKNSFSNILLAFKGVNDVSLPKKYAICNLIYLYFYELYRLLWEYKLPNFIFVDFVHNDIPFKDILNNLPEAYSEFSNKVKLLYHTFICDNEDDFIKSINPRIDKELKSILQDSKMDTFNRNIEEIIEKIDDTYKIYFDHFNNLISSCKWNIKEIIDTIMMDSSNLETVNIMKEKVDELIETREDILNEHIAHMIDKFNYGEVEGVEESKGHIKIILQKLVSDTWKWIGKIKDRVYYLQIRKVCSYIDLYFKTEAESSTHIINYYILNDKIPELISLLEGFGNELPEDDMDIFECRELETKCLIEAVNLIYKTCEVDNETKSLKINIGIYRNEFKKFLEQYVFSSVVPRFITFEYYGLSTGQRYLLSFYGRLYDILNQNKLNKKVLNNNLIFLLDEPTNAFHPEWEIKYLKALLYFADKFLGDKASIKFVISTHSPLLISDIQKENIILLKKNDTTNRICVDNTLEDNKQTFAANVHTLLSDSFFLESLIGAYAKEHINIVIDELQKSKVDKRKKDFIYNVINIIGEPVIRNKLLNMYNEKFNTDITSLQDEVEELKRQIKALKWRGKGI